MNLIKSDIALRLHLLYISFQTPTNATEAHIDLICCHICTLRLQYDRLSPLLDLFLFKLRIVLFFGLSRTRWFVLNVGCFYVNPAATA